MGIALEVWLLPPGSCSIYWPYIPSFGTCGAACGLTLWACVPRVLLLVFLMCLSRTSQGKPLRAGSGNRLRGVPDHRPQSIAQVFVYTVGAQCECMHCGCESQKASQLTLIRALPCPSGSGEPRGSGGSGTSHAGYLGRSLSLSGPGKVGTVTARTPATRSSKDSLVV